MAKPLPIQAGAQNPKGRSWSFATNRVLRATVKITYPQWYLLVTVLGILSGCRSSRDL